jgi:exodeoxyribonuclease VII small subunit
VTAPKANSPQSQSPQSQSPQSQSPRPAYEQARDELTEVVKRLEAGGLTLEQSLELWERGERLAAICAEWLEGARARLAAAMAQRTDADGDPAAPF